MASKALLLCLLAVVILHCCVAKKGKGKESNTWSWKRIKEVVGTLPEKIVKSCGEEAVYGAVSRLCTDFGPARCQSVVDTVWDAYNHFGFATGPLPVLQTICNTLGDWLVQLAEVAARIAWKGLTAILQLGLSYALSSGGWRLLE